MKMHIRMAAVLFVAVVLAACGGTKPGVSDKKVVRDENKNNATMSAVDEQISDSEAFNMAEEYVANMSLEEKIGQLFLVSVSKIDEPKGQKSYYEVTDSLKECIRKYHVGGVILQNKNIKDMHHTKELIAGMKGAASGGALYIAVEEDGGGDFSVSTKCPELKAGGYMTPQEMGESMSPLQIYQKGVSIGAELKSWGINLNLSPVADISYIGNKEYAKRCLGSDEDTEKVTELLSSYVNGFRESGMSVTLQKFPGMGMVNGDTTKKICESKETLMQLRENELKVYSEGAGAGAECIMVGNMHMSKLVSDTTPAFMSEEIVTKLLRKEVGFSRVVLTSPLCEEAVTKNFSQEYAMTEALKAGCDMLVEPEDFEEAYQTLMDDARVGRLEEKVINTAVRRIITNKITAGILVLEDKK